MCHIQFQSFSLLLFVSFSIRCTHVEYSSLLLLCALIKQDVDKNLLISISFHSRAPLSKSVFVSFCKRERAIDRKRKYKQNVNIVRKVCWQNRRADRSKTENNKHNQLMDGSSCYTSWVGVFCFVSSTSPLGKLQSINGFSSFSAVKQNGHVSDADDDGIIVFFFIFIRWYHT